MYCSGVIIKLYNYSFPDVIEVLISSLGHCFKVVFKFDRDKWLGRVSAVTTYSAGEIINDIAFYVIVTNDWYLLKESYKKDYCYANHRIESLVVVYSFPYMDLLLYYRTAYLIL